MKLFKICCIHCIIVHVRLVIYSNSTLTAQNNPTERRYLDNILTFQSSQSIFSGQTLKILLMLRLLLRIK